MGSDKTSVELEQIGKRITLSVRTESFEMSSQDARALAETLYRWADAIDGHLTPAWIAERLLEAALTEERKAIVEYLRDETKRLTRLGRAPSAGELDSVADDIERGMHRKPSAAG